MSTPIKHHTPRVFVTCLAAYNSGDLHGQWVDATDEDELRESVKRVLASSPIPNAEEHFFSDTDGFGNLVSEYTSVDQVARLGALIEEHGLEVVELVSDYAGGDPDDIDRRIDEVERYSAGPHASQHHTLECWAQELTEDISGELPSWVHIDWHSTARDLLIDYHHEFAPNGDLLLLRV